ncbi:a9813c91-6da8-4ba8-bdaa-77c5e7a7ec40 [Sclerotinia trifoliorum]|uniref:A9813c91-6da8-4ba8-bdaa-77c5e7a7ec40 n=1 Tax=Sclerotinia trifoliorum TaxID=28548 RepID=A0A8H2VWG1_9HELO|nr:a9813c91-6da8-4ba8-bdaa-77c5e7a7ec40 [Sclerotinia trifoliorum]
MFLNLQSKIILAFLISSIHAETTQICDPTANATTNSGRYTFFSDVVATDNSINQCTDFTLADDTSTNTTTFTTTFSLSNKKPNTSIPHSFPSLSLNLPSILPIPISNISLFPLTNNWALYPGNPVSSITSTSISSLENASVAASCYLNIYLDVNSSLSQTPSLAATKISIWQANYGDVVPEGYNSNRATISRPVIDLAGITYTLYTFQSSPSYSSPSSSPTNTNTTTQTHHPPLIPKPYTPGIQIRT